MHPKTDLRVLILRLGAMGDILHALPAVTALRQANPGWFLGWAVEPRWQALLRAESDDDARRNPATMPLVDRLHPVNVKQWASSPLSISTLRDIRRVRRKLREAEYEVCVDLQGAVRSAMIGRWAKPERMIGEEHPREAAARWLFHERVETRGPHVIEQAVEVVSAIANQPLPIVPAYLPRDPVAEAWCDRLLADTDKTHTVILNPGAGWGAKRWPSSRYGQVAAELADLGYTVVVNAGPEEAHLAADSAHQSGGAAITVHPSLGELIALTRRASLMIAGDTGPLHLACALGVPVVGIFGPTDPARNGPFGCDFRVLRHPESKRDHTRRSEPEAGLLTITPEEVIQAATELLGSRQKASLTDGR